MWKPEDGLQTHTTLLYLSIVGILGGSGFCSILLRDFILQNYDII
jgi:hypothetical protein